MPKSISRTQSLNVWVELSEACQLKCRFCYNPWRETPARHHAEMAVPTIDRLVSFLERAAADGYSVDLALAGGDPTAHADFVGVVTKCVRHVRRACLVTHGSDLPVAQLGALANLPTVGVQFSIPSLDPPTYEFLTGGADLANALTALAACQRLGIPRALSVVLTRRNAPDAVATVHLAAEAGADYLVLNRFLSAGRGALYDDAFSLDEAAFEAIVGNAAAAAARRGVRLLASGNDKAIRGLKAANPKITVGIDGSVRVCSLSEARLARLEDSAASVVAASADFWRSDAALPACLCSQTSPAAVGIRYTEASP